MCVLLCANRSVHEWLDIPLARSYRQALQLSAICPDDYFETAATHGSAGPQLAVKQLNKASVQCVMKRATWIQAYCSRMAQRQRSSQDWHKTLDAIANAWGRLLSLVGLRW